MNTSAVIRSLHGDNKKRKILIETKHRKMQYFHRNMLNDRLNYINFSLLFSA